MARDPMDIYADIVQTAMKPMPNVFVIPDLVGSREDPQTRYFRALRERNVELTRLWGELYTTVSADHSLPGWIVGSVRQAWLSYANQP